MTTFTIAQAQQDFAGGLLDGAAIFFHDANTSGEPCYTVAFQQALTESSNTGELVDARTGEVQQFETMDAAHAAIRQIGFKPGRFWIRAA